MANKKISELPSASASATSVIPASDAAGTVTNRVTVRSILDAEPRWAFFLPGAPTNVTAAAGNAQVTLSWSAPSVLPQAPVTDYVVQYKLSSASEWTTFSDGVGTSTSAVITGLTNGVAYVARVAAVNEIGQGAWSAESAAVTPPA